MQNEFERLSRLLMEYLCNNHHPHTTITITSTTAELVEGIQGFQTMEYVKD